MNMKSRLAIAAIAVVVSVAAVGIGFAQQNILNDTKRPAEERARDAGSKPLELYAFFDVETGSTVADLMPGGGYNTYILSKLVGSSGKVYSGPDRRGNLGTRVENDGLSNVEIIEGFDAMPEGGVDVIITVRNVHDLMNRGNATDPACQWLAALKPGGILGVVDARHAQARIRRQHPPRQPAGSDRPDHGGRLRARRGFRDAGQLGRQLRRGVRNGQPLRDRPDDAEVPQARNVDMSCASGEGASRILVGAGVAMLLVAPASAVSDGAGISRGAVATPAAAQAPDAVDPLLEQSIGYYTGIAGEVDDARAHELLLEAVADGDVLSQMWLARVYSRGRMFFERDDAKAREIAAGVIGEVTRLARANVAEAAFLMGTAYTEGLGMEINEDLAFAWYFRAANLGNALAAHNLGNAYREGAGLPQDSNIAAYWYRLAADKGDALPMFWLGQMYEAGEGVEQSREQALRWYRESANRGRADAGEALERLGG